MLFRSLRSLVGISAFFGIGGSHQVGAAGHSHHLEGHLRSRDRLGVILFRQLLDERQLLGVTLIEWPDYFGIFADSRLGVSDLYLTITRSDEELRSVDLRTGDANRLAAIAVQWQTQHAGATAR